MTFIVLLKCIEKFYLRLKKYKTLKKNTEFDIQIKY